MIKPTGMAKQEIIMGDIAVTIPPHSLSIAAAKLGLPRNTSKSAILRIALALGKGMSREEVLSYARPRASNLEIPVQKIVSFDAPAELISESDKNRSFLVRVGLGLAAGMTRKEAEAWARMPSGRVPRKGAGES
jgi:hypothetical protein